MIRIQKNWWKWTSGLLLLGMIIGMVLGSGAAGRENVARAAPARAYNPLDILISEIAWSGTAYSVEDEWIELYNPGTIAIDLTGWMLVADDGSPSITITGCASSCSLAGGRFFLIEWGDDGNVSDVAADLIYTPLPGFLSDSGEVLRLRAPDGGGGYTDVDIANLGAGGGWYEGSGGATYASMERKDVVADAAGAWGTNDCTTQVNGLDANNDPLCATPKQLNSVWEQPATATPTPGAPVHIVISEFRSRGPNGDNDEFIEIFNPSNVTVNIGKWFIQRSSACGGSTTKIYTFPTNTLLYPGQHHLLATTASLIANPDATFSPGINDIGGIALFNAVDTTPVDAVGMCAGTLYYEGIPLAQLAGDAIQSYERLPGGPAGECYDRNNNSIDFHLNTSPSPQNRVSPFTYCSGVPTATVTNTPTGTATPTKTQTRTPTPPRTATRTNTPYPGMPVVNEILPHPRTDWNADGVADVGDEYIEIINVGVLPANLKGYVLEDRNEEDSYTLPEIILQPYELVRLYGSETGILLSDGGDEVHLIRPNGQIADAFSFGLVEAVDRTWCRLPDGRGAWAFVCWPTPGSLNALYGRGPSANVIAPVCDLPARVPASIRIAECGSPGDAIWNSSLWRLREFWLNSRGKWALYIE